MNNLVVNASEIESLKDKVGTFTFKRLTIKELVSRQVRYFEYTGGKEIDIPTSNQAYMISTIEHALVNKPDWFDLNEIYEPNIIDELYNKYDEWVLSFRKDIPKKDKTNS